MTKLDYKTYIVNVKDPATGVTAAYPAVRAVSKDHADRQGRDAFCGLLGTSQEALAALEVEVVEIEL